MNVIIFEANGIFILRIVLYTIVSSSFLWPSDPGCQKEAGTGSNERWIGENK